MANGFNLSNSRTELVGSELSSMLHSQSVLQSGGGGGAGARERARCRTSKTEHSTVRLRFPAARPNGRSTF